MRLKSVSPCLMMYIFFIFVVFNNNRLKKINPNITTDITTRLKYTITSINGNRDQKAIREFADSMLVQDARALRQRISQVSPDIEMKFIPNDENYTGEGIEFTPGLDFFWPDAGI